jgi:hypothetical protein
MEENFFSLCSSHVFIFAQFRTSTRLQFWNGVDKSNEILSHSQRDFFVVFLLKRQNDDDDDFVMIMMLFENGK